MNCRELLIEKKYIEVVSGSNVEPIYMIIPKKSIEYIDCITQDDHMRVVLWLRSGEDIDIKLDKVIALAIKEWFTT